MQPRSKRTPELVTSARYCVAKKHNRRTVTEVQSIETEDALNKLRQYQYVENGGLYSFSHLRLGDYVCKECRAAALREVAAPPATPVARRSGGVVDLMVTSPIVAESTARALAAAPVLSHTSFEELDLAHPWASMQPLEVQQRLLSIPGIANVLVDVPPVKVREFLSGLGVLVWNESAPLRGMLERAERDARRLKEMMDIERGTMLWRLVEQEMKDFMAAMQELDPFDRGTWSEAQRMFASDVCSNLRNLLGVLVNVKGAAARNLADGRQGKTVKLRKVCLVLLQLCRLRSERFTMFAVKFSTYLHFRCVPEAVSVLEVQLGLTADPDTRRKALDAWRKKSAQSRVVQAIVETPAEVAFVGDNVNLYRGVRDFVGGRRGNQMNLFAVALFRREMPSTDLPRTQPQPCRLAVVALALDVAGYVRMKDMLRWALHGALESFTVEGLPPAPERNAHLCRKTEWVPITMTAHDSSRPAEVWEMLKSLVTRLGLTGDRVWPFYGDMLTCKYVNTASAVYSKDKFHPRSFRAEMGLFHTQMHTIQKLLFVHYQKDLAEAASRLGFHKILYEPVKNYNVFERVCSGLFVAVAVSAWHDMGKQLDAVVDRMWRALQRPEANVGDNTFRLLGFLALNSAWKRLVKLADGEGMFDLIRFLLPFLATVKSSMYFTFLVGWVQETLSLSPYDRALRLQNLFVNRSGEPGHAREVDLEFEYLVCGIKRMSESLPSPTPENLEQLVQDFPLFEQLRDEVDADFRPAKISTSRSVRKNKDAIAQVVRWYQGRCLSESETSSKAKDAPLLFAFDKFRKKIDKMVAAIPRQMGVDVEASGDALTVSDMEDLMALDEYEKAFLSK